jgi:peptide/nickel transport system substrate-binding protein
MSKRFSRIDFVMYFFLGCIFVLILLAMYMVDRQWEMMSRIRGTLVEQARDLGALREDVRSLRGELKRGAKLNVSGDEFVSGVDDNFPVFARADTLVDKSDYTQGDWLVRAFATGLKTISPLVSSDAYAARVQNFVLESLLTRNPDTLEWEGHIAKSWQISEDGLTITFDVREGVTFSDGESLDASDVAFTFDFIMDESIAAPRERASLDKIESVTSSDANTVVFKFREPYFNSLALAGGLNILPQHFYRKYLQQPEAFNQSKGILLGSGPYRLNDPVAWTPDAGLVELERNPRYWGPIQPSYKRILWKIIENDSARLTTFRNGDIDVYDARPREYQTLLDDEKLRQQTNNFEYMSPTAGYSYIGWNQKRDGTATRFADRRVRLAMTYLTDRQRTIEEIMLGHAEQAHSPFNPRSAQHDKTLAAHGYSVEKALALLTEVGFQDRDGDGILEDSNGKPFEFELVYFQGSEDTKRIVLFLKDLYARVGILMKPLATEWSVMIDLIDKRNFDAITLGWTSGVETDIYQMFHSAQIEEGGDNFINFKSTELDQLIDRARATVNEKSRMALWRQAERIMHFEQPYTFLMRRKTLAFIDNRLQNLTITNLGLNLDFVPIETYVPAILQKYAD